ncbi:MAG: hypothetical protein JWP61_2794 [Friedmanniella sp.]|nr:hypothetical protein [Friedmanniella sp.]
MTEVSRRRTTTGTVRLVVVGLLVLAAFVGLRLAASARPTPVPLTLTGERLVVVGVTGRYQVGGVDRDVLDRQPQAQAGAMSVRPRYIGDCAAAGWTTLGAGRRAGVGGLCSPVVEGGRVTDWSQRLSAAAAAYGDARLGTLAASMPGCVAAVGPGAALAAARPDGRVARYQTAEAFVAAGLASGCPVTLVDGGDRSDAIVAGLAGRAGTSLVVTGIGPPPGRADPAPQLAYVLGSAPAGWLTSGSTRREGVLTLADLTRTVIDFGGGAADTALPVDGSPLQVLPGPVTAAAAQHRLAALDALSTAVLRGDLAVGIGGVVLAALFVLALRRRRYAAARLLVALAANLPTAMVLTGAVPWAATSRPGLVLSLTVGLLVLVLTGLSLVTARWLRVPPAVVAAAGTVVVFAADAALGAVMQPGSMLNSRPVNGGRWYGFGNVTFAVYASAALLLVGYLAHRWRAAGRPRTALLVAATVGFGVVATEGWPTMGADFGGVIVLTPVLLGLLLVWSGLRITWGRVLAVGGASVLAAALISWLDWRRGPAARSHLGAFVQRILDGDAQDVIARKAAAAGESLLTPAGLGSVLLGAVVWWLVFRRGLPPLLGRFSTLRTTAAAALAAAVLGTVLNDGGVTVWYTLTTAFTVSVVALRTGVLLRSPETAADATDRAARPG